MEILFLLVLTFFTTFFSIVTFVSDLDYNNNNTFHLGLIFLAETILSHIYKSSTDHHCNYNNTVPGFTAKLDSNRNAICNRLDRCDNMYQ